MVAARITFGRRSFHAAANPTEGGLVTTGPYAYIRHPIYAAILYFVWAGALDTSRWRRARLGGAHHRRRVRADAIEEHLLVRTLSRVRATTRAASAA